MGTSRIIIGLALAGMVSVGCKKEPEKVVQPTPSAPAQTTAPSTPATTEPAVTITPPPPVTPPTTPTPPIDTPATGDTAVADADAKQLLTKASVDIGDKKWDAAGDDFKKLNDMRPQLSQKMKDSVTKAEEKFVAAKATNSLNLPGFGSPTTGASY